MLGDLRAGEWLLVLPRLLAPNIFCMGLEGPRTWLLGILANFFHFLADFNVGLITWILFSIGLPFLSPSFSTYEPKLSILESTRPMTWTKTLLGPGFRLGPGPGSTVSWGFLLSSYATILPFLLLLPARLFLIPTLTASVSICSKPRTSWPLQVNSFLV
ncbi:hypothetical protein ACOSQ2_014980 [Xanthoceras sorbifolium]